MDSDLSPAALRVQAALRDRGVDCQVLELPASTRTAADAARAIGCDIGQIVKSLVFRGRQSGTAVLVLASGANHIDETRLGAVVGEPIEKASADFVRLQTGFAIGGVPPVGHAERLPTVIDSHLLAYRELWAAAGTPHAVFRLTVDDLRRLTVAEVAAVAE